MRVLYLFLFVILFVSCNNDDDFQENLDEKVMMDVAYGNDPLQKMDIYLPAGRTSAKTKVFVLIHGGGWSGGDKSDFDNYMQKFRQDYSDYAVVTLNYRLVQTSIPYMLPYQIDDISSALNFLNQNALEYAIKPEYVFAGVSAGGHLSMLYDYKYDSGNRVKAVINIVGPTNLSDPYYTNYPQYPDLAQYIIAPADLPAGYSAPDFASPITWISNSSSPTISFFGDNDPLVPVSQKTFIDQKFSSTNVANESYVYVGGHDIGGIYLDEINEKCKTFLQNNL